MDNKKIVTWLGTIVIIIFAITVGFFVWQYEKNNSQNIEQTQIQIPKPVTKQTTTGTGKTINIENSQLIEIAKKYVLNKPQLYLNRAKFVDWNDYKEIGSTFSKATPEWIISQKVNVEYIEPNKNERPYDDLNNKYIISWFFIPGCEENQNSKNEPNWFDKFGFWCMGGYTLNVVINPDSTINHAELNAMN